MAATARSLAARGCSALIVDLYGTGDSEGDFSDATWDCWTQDVESAVNWAVGNGLSIDAVIASRLGCLLAADSYARAGLLTPKTVFWQPVASGEHHMNQFLRHGVAASMMKSKGGVTVGGLKQRLRKGETLEIAGYPLSADLWSDVDQLRTSDHLGAFLGEVHILEVGRNSGTELSPAGARIETAAIELGLPTRSLRLRGEPYWTSTEVVVNAALCRSTVQIVVGGE